MARVCTSRRDRAVRGSARGAGLRLPAETAIIERSRSEFAASLHGEEARDLAWRMMGDWLTPLYTASVYGVGDGASAWSERHLSRRCPRPRVPRPPRA